jgi:hypothetical protein
VNLPAWGIRAQLLTQQARKSREAFGQGALVVAFVDKAANRYLLLPVEDHGTPRFEGAVRESAARGFQFLGALALYATDDGQPLIGDEAGDGADHKHIEAARQLFMDDLISKGELRPDTPVA